jgi:hypothetical protein
MRLPLRDTMLHIIFPHTLYDYTPYRIRLRSISTTCVVYVIDYMLQQNYQS